MCEYMEDGVKRERRSETNGDLELGHEDVTRCGPSPSTIVSPCGYAGKRLR